MNKSDIKHLYNKISKVNDNNNSLEINKLVEFIKREGMPYSENSNGLFVNLSTLDDKVILKLEEYLATPDYKISHNKDIIYDLTIDYHQFEKSTVPKEDKIDYKNFNLSSLEKKILTFSKLNLI